MQGKYQQRFPAVQARHGKRFPQFRGDTIPDNNTGGSSALGLPGPVTITIVQTLPTQPPSSSLTETPAVTASVPLTTSTSVSTSSLSSSSIPLGSPLTPSTIQPSSSSATSTIRVPTPSASANNDGSKTDMSPQSDAAASRQIPTGSIIGIVVVVVVVLIAAVVFLVRRRFIQNRLRMRGGWADKEFMGPSFLWIEPREKSSIVPRPQTQNLPYATSQVYVPPVPPRPPPIHSTDNPDFGPPPSSALGLSIPAALVPGAGATTVSSGYYSSALGGYASSSPESATVRSTFIPTLPDELSIAQGEVLRIVSVYDDGWVLCSNARGEMGMVPLECLDQGVTSQAQQEGKEYRNLSRVSSLAASPRPYGGTKY